MKAVGPTDCDPDRPVVTDKDSDYDKADETHVLQACNQRTQIWMNYFQASTAKNRGEESLIIVFKEFQS